MWIIVYIKLFLEEALQTEITVTCSTTEGHFLGSEVAFLAIVTSPPTEDFRNQWVLRMESTVWDALTYDVVALLTQVE